jgi:Integrase core domain
VDYTCVVAVPCCRGAGILTGHYQSFFHTLKTALIHLEDFDTHDHAQTAVFEYIEVFYNNTSDKIQAAHAVMLP